MLSLSKIQFISDINKKEWYWECELRKMLDASGSVLTQDCYIYYLVCYKIIERFMNSKFSHVSKWFFQLVNVFLSFCLQF
jgi:hypothetical protein